MESIISTFHIDWKIIITQALNFGIVFGVLYLFALKPLQKIMTERSEKINKGITDARDNAMLLTKTKEEYDKILAQARQEAQKIFEEGKREAQTKKDNMLSDAKAEVASMIDDGKKVLAMEKIKMIEEAKAEVATLAVKAAEKILGSKVEGASDKAIRELNNL